MEDVYFARYAWPTTMIKTTPSEHVRSIIVVPSYNEPVLINCLNSLAECLPTQYPVEIIVVINFTTSESNDKKEAFQQHYMYTASWANKHSTKQRTFHILYLPNLPEKTGGVGLARKVGMDEAARRLQDDGFIICLDADCTCAPNYLKVLEEHFLSHPNTPGCSIYYEHPLEGDYDETIYKGITRYELFLRYYVHAQRFSGFPFAYQTVGSSMAVRAGTYKRQGGMNKRKAGEDFYFLSKIIPLGNFTEIRNTTVYPSPRESTRVPFGTGKAMIDWCKTGAILTYPLDVFIELKNFFARIEILYKLPSIRLQSLLSEQGKCLQSFLTINDFEYALESINQKSPSLQTFVNHFFQWFNGFRIMKFVNYACNSHYSRVDILEASNNLLKELLPSHKEEQSAKDLLIIYRKIDRGEIIITM